MSSNDPNNNTITTIDSNNGTNNNTQQSQQNPRQIQSRRKERKPTFIERSFQKAGLRPIHVPAGIVLFNGMLWVEWLAILVLSVRYRPIRQLMRFQPKMVRWHNNLHRYRFYNRMENWATKSADQMATNHYFLRLGKYLNTTPDNFAYGLIETIVLYNTGLLVLAPINFVSTLIVLRYFGNKFSGTTDASDENSGNNGNDNSNGNDTGSNSNRNENNGKNSENNNNFSNKFASDSDSSVSHSSVTNVKYRNELKIEFGDSVKCIQRWIKHSNNINKNYYATNTNNMSNIDNNYMNHRENYDKNSFLTLKSKIFENYKAIETFFDINGKRYYFSKSINNVNRNETRNYIFNGKYARIICDISKYPYNIASMLLTPLKQNRNEMNSKYYSYESRESYESCMDIVNNFVGYCKRNMYESKSSLFGTVGRAKKQIINYHFARNKFQNNNINSNNHNRIDGITNIYNNGNNGHSGILFKYPTSATKLLSMSRFDKFRFENF